MSDSPNLRLELVHHRLANGLEVTLHADHSIPIVAVDLWYHVGSKDEDAAHTGLAHLFEHLMFEGSARHDDDYFRPLQEAGGTVNGSTSQDRTNYYEVVPSNFLELALWLEADRMGRLLPVLDQAKLDNQRSVVMNERRQRVDNQPYGRISERIAERLYPAHHPYSWPIIGWMEHLETMTLSDVRAFFQAHYRPDNATIVVAGAIDPAAALGLIERHFGEIPATTAPAPAGRTPPTIPRCSLAGEERVEWEEAVGLPRLDLVWPAVARFAPAEPALDFAARILAGRSKDSRLKRRLVIAEPLVQSIGAYHHSQRWAGEFGIRAFGLDDRSLERAEKIVLEEIQALARHGPEPDEMARARHEFHNDFYSRMETVLGKADLINHYRFYQGTVHAESASVELALYDAVTTDQVARAALEYLGAGRVAVLVRPSRVKLANGAAASSTSPASSTESSPAKKQRRGTTGPVPGPGPTPAFRLPIIERAKVSSGLSLVVVRLPKVPRVDARYLTAAGSVYDPVDRIGLARLVADVLDEGTLARDGLELARALDRIGSTVGVGSGVESGQVSLRCLQAELAASFVLFAEVIQQPRFAEADFERERGRLRAEIAYRVRQPAYLADEAIDGLIYGPRHPYGRPADGTLDGIEAITSADLATFHRRHFSPAKATLIVVGDTHLDEVVELAERTLGAPWPVDGNAGGAERPLVAWPPEEDGAGSWLARVDRAGAAQSVLRFGKRSIARAAPEYFPLLVLNAILGGQFTSRLNLNLREAKGYTYGARSSLSLRRAGGAFIAGADVDSAATRAAAVEFLAEITGPALDRPIRPGELATAKAYLTRRFPAQFETASAIGAHLAQLVIYDLADDYYDRYRDQVEAVSLDDLHAVARTHLGHAGIKVAAVGDPAATADLVDLLAP